jgi:hypothetical protein
MVGISGRESVRYGLASVHDKDKRRMAVGNMIVGYTGGSGDD